jgi:hypothetical protein
MLQYEKKCSSSSALCTLIDTKRESSGEPKETNINPIKPQILALHCVVSVQGGYRNTDEHHVDQSLYRQIPAIRHEQSGLQTKRPPRAVLGAAKLFLTQKAAAWALLPTALLLQVLAEK